MRIAVIVLCMVLGGCGIYQKKGRGGGTNIDTKEPGGPEVDTPHKRL